MNQVISTEQTPIKMWLDDIEEGALKQAKNLANLPFVFNHIAIMPDSHQGYGMPIGGILATMGVIICNAVGVDIGCGICAIKTSLKELTIDQIKILFGGSKKYHGGIRSTIPAGFSHHSKKQDENFMPEAEKEIRRLTYPIVYQEYENALKQIGTLGGGNHFIEIQKGDDDHIWIMIHSGSRNIGYQVAKYYNNLAKQLNKRWYTSVPKNWDLAFLPIETLEAKQYLREMEYCVEFAFANRKLMMDRIMKIFQDQFTNITFDPMINIAHNYARFENHFGRNVIIHRKGATSAKIEELGIIAGSQGTSSYIVEGLGNPESFNSCSHGAGRKMSRTKAKNELNLEFEKAILDNQGIVHSVRNISDLDEATSSYKDINEVINNQKDLIKIKVKLKPLGVIKG